MRTQSIDTHPEIERIQIDMIRTSPLSKRFSSVASWTRTLLWANVHAWQTEDNTKRVSESLSNMFLQETVIPLLHSTRHGCRGNAAGLVPSATRPRDCFSPLLSSDSSCLGVPSYLAGSIASSRSMACNNWLRIAISSCTWTKRAVPSFVSLFQQDYVFDETGPSQSSATADTVCTLIHLDSLMKLDLHSPSTQMLSTTGCFPLMTCVSS